MLGLKHDFLKSILKVCVYIYIYTYIYSLAVFTEKSNAPGYV